MGQIYAVAESHCRPNTPHPQFTHKVGPKWFLDYMNKWYTPGTQTGVGAARSAAKAKAAAEKTKTKGRR